MVSLNHYARSRPMPQNHKRSDRRQDYPAYRSDEDHAGGIHDISDSEGNDAECEKGDESSL